MILGLSRLRNRARLRRLRLQRRCCHGGGSVGEELGPGFRTGLGAVVGGSGTFAF